SRTSKRPAPRRTCSSSDATQTLRDRGGAADAGARDPGLGRRPSRNGVDTRNARRAAVEEAKMLLRLGLAVRSMAAAEASHEIGIEHAGTRHAFGKPIGAFQAVSHRCANCQIDIVAARGLVDEAVRLHGVGDPMWPLASELAVA